MLRVKWQQRKEAAGNNSFSPTAYRLLLVGLTGSPMTR
jgi:hypothetical protein